MSYHHGFAVKDAELYARGKYGNLQTAETANGKIYNIF